VAGRPARGGEGFTGIKIKVGSTVERDLRRLEAVRRAIGPRRDAGHRRQWQVGPAHLPALLPRRRALDVYWFEEPLWYDDVKGHAELARATRIPVALGEQLYTRTRSAEFFHQNAIHWVQPDVTRMAGLTEVLRVCETAHSYRLPVAPHAGDMSQVHVHLSYAHPAVQVLEYIPWIKDCFTDPAALAFHGSLHSESSIKGRALAANDLGQGSSNRAPQPSQWPRRRNAPHNVRSSADDFPLETLCAGPVGGRCRTGAGRCDPAYAGTGRTLRSARL
jgi:hypothetical protein